ncbi:hypothetical protein MSP8887_02658 [Marinomonas spartinae]|uniref:phage major tropism determinant n=1 Tax=Marinomonas spartinae TaxID=1792290 RepID=UPI000808D721|nr:hypothetical protein [Marinomonas spartinae]SBS36629.1 hypothetical protein MSP8887_02658 [Marinomonas spartinae]
MNYPDSNDLYNGKFTDGDPLNAIPASIASADHMNAVYDELINVIKFAGVTPEANVKDQLTQALEFYRNASHLNAGTVPIARMHGSKTLFEKNIASQPAFQLDSETLKNAADLTVAVNGVAYEYREGVELVLPGSMSIGTDYAIYATPDGLVVSPNFTVPEGYTALTSRRVGGFHYQNGEINEFSVYDLKYYPDARNWLTGANDPRGMARVPGVGWVDIYMLNTTPDLLGTSAFGAKIADGASPLKKPQYWGGDGVVQYSDFSQYIASRVLAAYGKRLVTTHEHEQLAFGTVTGAKVGSDPITIQYHAPTTSKFGIVGATGVMWQWALERWDRGDGSNGYGWTPDGMDGEGQLYKAGLQGVGAAIVGSDWDGSEPGPRASYWGTEPSNSGYNIAARGVSGHFEQL